MKENENGNIIKEKMISNTSFIVNMDKNKILNKIILYRASIQFSGKILNCCYAFSYKIVDGGN